MSSDRMGTHTDAGNSGKRVIKGCEIRQESRCKAPMLESGRDRAQALPRHSEDSAGKRILFIGAKDQ